MEKNNFNSVCLIASCGCNLKCKYCELAKNNNKEYVLKMQQETINAFKDGSYLQNVIKDYEFFNQDLTNIKHISIWGQEPTMILSYFGDAIKDWLQAFSNWDSSFFSTNGGTDPNILYDFIVKLDNNLNHNFTLGIQYSYDGEWSCKTQRNIEPAIIKNNFKSLIEKLNEKVLHHVKVNFVFHGVLSAELINYLLEDDSHINDYLIDFDSIIRNYSQLIKNPSCSLDCCPSIFLQQPYDASTTDGINLATLIDKCLRFENIYQFYKCNPIRSLLHHSAGRLNLNQKIFRKDNKWISMIANSLEPTLRTDLFLKDGTCGAYSNELKIIYDGTIVSCQNHMYDTLKENIKTEDLMLKAIKENLINHNHFINPAKNKNINEVELNKVLSIYEKQNAISTYQSILNMMILLADCGQIKQDYKYNKEKLLKHGLLVLRQNSCYYNRLITSGSFYLESSGLCRMLCNGFLDIVEEQCLSVESEKNPNE